MVPFFLFICVHSETLFWLAQEIPRSTEGLFFMNGEGYIDYLHGFDLIIQCIGTETQMPT